MPLNIKASPADKIICKITIMGMAEKFKKKSSNALKIRNIYLILFSFMEKLENLRAKIEMSDTRRKDMIIDNNAIKIGTGTKLFKKS